ESRGLRLEPDCQAGDGTGHPSENSCVTHAAVLPYQCTGHGPRAPRCSTCYWPEVSTIPTMTAATTRRAATINKTVFQSSMRGAVRGCRDGCGGTGTLA